LVWLVVGMELVLELVLVLALELEPELVLGQVPV